jgi:four helix bundle protein
MEHRREFRETPVWQEAFELSTEIYRVTDDWPGDERHGLAADVRRESVTAASKLAAAIEVDGLKEAMAYAEVARESLGLVRTYLHVAEGLRFIDEATLEELMARRDKAAGLLAELERRMPNEKTDYDARGWFDLPSSSN